MLAAAPPIEAAKVRRAIKLSEYGERSLSQGELHQARQRFFKAIDLVDALPSAHIGLGHVAMREGRFEVALRQYEAAEAGWRSISRALLAIQHRVEINNYGRAMSLKGQLADSMQQLQRFGRGKDGEQRGEVLMMLKVQRTLNLLEQVRVPRQDEAFTPVPGEIYFYIGNALYMLNRWNDAIDNWETCAELSPGFAQVYGNLALGYRRLGDRRRARRYLDKARDLGSEVPGERWRESSGERE